MGWKFKEGFHPLNHPRPEVKEVDLCWYCSCVIVGEEQESPKYEEDEAMPHSFMASQKRG